ncbi:MAG: hypothetical protein K5905_04305 [Roseibium sp.]|uniref:hypothetical protein n=1 Tax=Roseibium sp. TaxID=1936156 RepID=UPI002612B15E|nr:hypothetical protein [Roseibium sp.]MCV0424672.1 hypothetical protein [Roseibium sp.]
MTLRWPSDLPLPERNPYQRQSQDPRISRRREAGPPGSRRRFSSVARFVSLTIDVSRNQKAIFDNFYEGDTAEGSLPFIMPDPTTHDWPLLDPTTGDQLQDPDGNALLIAAHWLCLFGEQTPTETIRGIRFQISFPVAVMP